MSGGWFNMDFYLHLALRREPFAQHRPSAPGTCLCCICADGLGIYGKSKAQSAMAHVSTLVLGFARQGPDRKM